MKSLDDLERIRERAKEATRLRDNANATRVVVGMGTCGIAAGAREVMTAILTEVARRGLADVIVTQTGCVGLCDQEPLVDVQIPGRPNVTYGRVDAVRARDIIARHVVNGQVIGDWVIATK